ncbi:unnamed protein product [Schistocephalus solidus]|uniref:Endonuclease/exonuclease/phosphatase family protein n=1 Tax=Schistocephalus solidus TaxID=70667 RepID=A0A183T8R3_SCHSO|nr:unnamed protein product [Schistocephalus solidus]
MRDTKEVPATACLPGDSRIFVFGDYNRSSCLAAVEFYQVVAELEAKVTSKSSSLTGKGCIVHTPPIPLTD